MENRAAGESADMRAIAALCLLCASCAHASIDGIYSCSILAGKAQVLAYVTVNGHVDGETIFAVAGTTPTPSIYGYGAGYLRGQSFTGVTAFGAPFNLTAGSGVLAGTVGIMFGSSLVNAVVSCGKIF